MRSVRGMRVVAAAVFAVSVVGCGLGQGGVPGGPEPFVGIELPPRPRDVPVRDVDPCDLLTEAQRAEIGLESPPLLTPDDRSLLFEGPEPLCTAVGFEPRAILVGVAVPYDGLGVTALTGRPVRSELTAVNVQGFPAVLARPISDPTFCQVLVDVAPGAAVSVNFRDGGRRNIPQDELCEGAVQVADAAMTTLLAGS